MIAQQRALECGRQLVYTLISIKENLLKEPTNEEEYASSDSSMEVYR
jgi:hypothetical protein